MTEAELWWHLVMDHGAHVHSAKHGDAELMHAAAHSAGFADHDHPDYRQEWRP